MGALLGSLLRGRWDFCFNLAGINCTHFKNVFSKAVGLILIHSSCVLVYLHLTSNYINRAYSYLVHTFGHIFQNLLNTLMSYIFLTWKYRKKVPQLKILEFPYESRQCICRNVFPEDHSDPLGEAHLPRKRVQYYGIRETWWVFDPGSILITYY